MTIIKRVGVYCIGLLFIAAGVTFSIKSQLGISPVNSIPYVLSLITKIDQGILIILFFSLLILIQIILLRKDFKLINLFQIAFSTIFGYFVNFTNYIFYFQNPENYFLKLILLFASMVLIALGIIFYIRARLIPMPAEGVVLAIQKVTKIEFHKIKSTMDTVLVITAASLSLIFLKNLIGVREGTILAAIFIGRIIGFIESKFNKQINLLTRFIEA